MDNEPAEVSTIMVVESVDAGGAQYETIITNYTSGDSIAVTTNTDTGNVVDAVFVPAGECISIE